MTKKALVLVVSILLIIGIAAAGCNKTCPDLNTKAPDFSLTELSGKTVALKDYEGKPVMLVFWQTTCGYCVQQMPLVQEAANKFAGSGLVVLAVNVGESPEKVKKYKEQGNYTLTFVLDKDATMNADYCVPAFPATVFISKQGLIKTAKLGAFQAETEIEEYLKLLN